MWIPLVNCFGWFIWLYNCFQMPQRAALLFKSIFVAFACSLPGVFVSILISKLFAGFLAHAVQTFIMLYLVPVFICFGLIRFQKKYDIR